MLLFFLFINLQVPFENSSKRSKSDKDNANEKNATKAKVEQNGTDRTTGDGKSSKDNPKPPKDYIHVRARRGSATNTHTRAERVMTCKKILTRWAKGLAPI